MLYYIIDHMLTLLYFIKKRKNIINKKRKLNNILNIGIIT